MLQLPWPPQYPQEFHWQLELQDRVWEPQFPHPWVSCWPWTQGPWPWQLDQDPQLQLEVQVLLMFPQFPQAWFSCWPTVYTPWLEQTLQPPQVQELVQTRVWVPQFPQAWVWDSPGEHWKVSSMPPSQSSSCPLHCSVGAWGQEGTHICSCAQMM